MQLTEDIEEAICVRLGAATETAPEVLSTLAREGSVTVRAAVAMNMAAPPDVDRRLASDRDERVRALLARKLAGQGPAGPDRQALEALVALAADAAVRVRATIADVVKRMPEAPRALILQLARDAVEAVSDPIIRLSPVLQPDDLLRLLANPPSLVTARSVARRPNLNEAISDAVAATADSAAIRALLSNSSAAIREATLDALVAMAPSNAEWHSPLVNRPALSARAARALSEIVATQLLETLANRPDLDLAVTGDLRHRLAERLAPPPEPPPAGIEPTAEEALDEAYALCRDGRLTEEAVVEAVQRGEARRVAAMLAVAADVPLAVIDRAASLRSAKGMISLIWQAGFSMRIAGPLQAMLAHLAPSAILPAGPGGAFPLAAEEMRWQLDFLQRMRR
jgi:hypothetical protein